ncbi:hypothetical protein JCM11641_004075 [Rhodosporidiobolus odoratus]
MYSLLYSSLLFSTALALPLRPRWSVSPCPSLPPSTEDCRASVLFPEFPEGIGGLFLPEGVRTVAVAVGFGNQTYTCSAASGAPVNTANAELYDVSSQLIAAPNPEVAKYQIVSYAYVYQSGNNPTYNISSASFVGTHSFVPFVNTTSSSPSSSPSPTCGCTGSTSTPTAPTAVLLPHFELTRTTCPGEGAGRFTGQRVASIPSPLSPPGAHVAWVQLKRVQGNGTGDLGLADWVYRTDTQGGGQQRNCSAVGQVDNVPYAALYWFLR